MARQSRALVAYLKKITDSLNEAKKELAMAERKALADRMANERSVAVAQATVEALQGVIDQSAGVVDDEPDEAGK